MKYSYRQGFRPKVHAEIAGFELERIREQNDGELRPPDVVEAARPDDAPLHPAFEWDDHLAAEAHRLHQARQLIRSVQVIKSDDSPIEPAYFSVQIDERRYYQSAAVLRDSADEYKSAKRLLANKLTGITAAVEDLARLADTHEPDTKRKAAIAKMRRPAQSLTRALAEATQ